MRATTRRAGRSLRNNRGSSELSEFAPVLYIMFLLILLPLLDIVTVFVAGTTQYLATNDFAAKAATQADFSSALNSMANEAYQFQANGLAQFVHMVPEGGYTGCGDDMYVLTTDIGTGTVASSAANLPLNQPIDTKAKIYELSVKSIYSVSPLVSLAAVPVLGNVPGLGQPVTLTFVANRPVEHPGGLQAAANGGVVGAGSVTNFARVNDNPGVSPPPTSITWRTPDIFKQIQAAGQTVVTVNVLNIQANYNNLPTAPPGGWVATGIVVQPGEKVWLDTQATGVWGCPGFLNNGDANGQANTPNWGANYDLAVNNMQLIGYIGSPPILPYGFSSGGTNDPRFIPSGDTLLNFPINYTGPISMACNDNQIGDYGSQMVRVIITK
jgi:hypothetical protein